MTQRRKFLRRNGRSVGRSVHIFVATAILVIYGMNVYQAILDTAVVVVSFDLNESRLLCDGMQKMLVACTPFR